METNRTEPTLGELLANLTDAVAEYQRVVNTAFKVVGERIDLCDRMIVEFRDDTHESLAALSNRIEGATRGTTAGPDMGARREWPRTWKGAASSPAQPNGA